MENGKQLIKIDKQMSRHLTLSKALTAVLLFIGIAFGQNAFAQTSWSVSKDSESGNTCRFKIQRTGDITQTVTVKYRTVSLSAFEGQHFTAVSGNVEFLANEDEKYVYVTENTPDNDAFVYQSGTQRSYRFEVTDLGGFYLASCDRTKTTGTQFSADKVSQSITNLVYFNSSGNYTTGVSSSKYVDVSYTPPTSQVETSGTLQGYVLIDDSYDYAQKAATVSTSSLINSTHASATYLKYLDYKIYATVCFTEKEKDDGYQYIQVVAGDGNASYDTGYDPEKSVNAPVNSVYKVCFELSTGSNQGQGKAFFPHRYNTATGTNEFSLSDGKLWQQRFKSGYQASTSGSLVFDANVSNITTRFDAGGDNDDTWGYKDLFVRMALVDANAPTKLTISVAPGMHARGNTLYVSVAFNEIVTVTGTPTLSTTPNNNWGSLSYVTGSGTNVLTFSTIIPDNATGNLNITGLSGTVKDLAGNSLVGSGVTANSLCSLNASYAYPISYDLAGGSVATANPTTYTYETATFSLNNPTKLGYDFTGWTGSNGNTPQTTVTIGNHSHGNKSYMANWNANTYSIRFNANDGTGTAATGTMSNQSFTYDVAQNLTANAFERTGYTFAGWNTQASGGGTSYTNQQEVINLTPENGAIIDLYAQWDVHHYTVHFDKNKDAASGTMADQSFTYDQGSLNANAFTCTGYIFNGWNTEANGSGASYTDQQAIPNVTATNDAAVTLYAQWTPISYTVHFDANYDNNGIVISGTMSDQTLTYDQGALNANAFERTGYTFTGWNTQSDGSGATYTDQQVSPNVTATNGATVTLYAQWDITPWTGIGISENNPYFILYASQLMKLAHDVNSGTNEYQYKFFKLGDDIDMSGIDFEGIGYSYNHYFKGYFNGDNKTISNLTVNKLNTSYVGLFGYLTTSVSNLILSDATITGGYATGAIAGGTTANAALRNCLVINTNINSNNAYSGVFVGDHNSSATLTHNYYYNCTLNKNNTPSTINIGIGSTNGSTDVDGARSAHTLTLPEHIIATSADTVTYNHVLYYASNVSVTLSPEIGYAISDVTVNGEAATNNGDGTWSFDMPAAAATVSATVNLKLPGTGEANNPYMISTTAQFDLVATLVNNGESYSGVYFKLADNANITVSNMIGTSEHPFNGNFDGNRSHNATLTLDLLFDTEVIYTAPFRYVSGANIHDLFVGGNMRIGNNSQYAASIVAYSEGTTILNNCVSNVEINSEAHNSFAYNGGLVGHVASESTLNITNCVFKGSVFYHNSGQCCGFVGLNHGTTNINGGIYEPSYQQLYSYYYYYNFINPDMGTYSLTDCYYTQPMGESWQGTIAYTSVRDNLCHQISIAGETVYASPDNTFIDNVNGVYDYTGAVININPTVIFGGETLDPSCYTLSLTYNGNPATEVNARGNYLYTASGVNANGYYGNVYRYFSVVGFDGSGTDSDPYLIESIEDWNKLASRVYDGTTYSGKHFKLMANLTISKVVGYNKINSFQGIFDGDGHTLTLNGDDFGTSGYYTSFHVCAPFRYVAGTTIKNLKVAGDIYTRTQYAGGLIGRAGDGDNVIQNCIVSVNIHSSISGDGTHGGFIAHLQGSNGVLCETTFTGCAFTGSITTTNNTTNVGGFVGWCDWGNGPDNGHCRLFFNDCFINPSASCISSGSKTFARCNDESQSLHFNNGYFTQAIGDSQGKRVENDGALPIGSYTLYNVSGLKFYDNGLKDSDGTFYHYINAPSNYIKRQFIGYGDNNDHWAFIASPLEDNISPNDVNNLLDNNEAYYDLYRINPSNTRWENWKEHEGNAASNFNFVNGMGYLYATKYNRIVTFTGTLNMGGEKTITGLPNGYNLVGNPFCIEAYVNKPYYTLDDNGAIIVANPVDKATPIQPCYGVIVKVENNEDVVFRTTEPFMNSSNGSLEMTLAQTVATRDGNALKTLDNAIITFDEVDELGKFYFGHQDANIYIPQNGKEYAIAYSDAQGEMPLNFKAVTNGSYTLTVNPEGLEMDYLHLIDNLTGANIDLLQTPSYTFDARTTDYASRFKLVFNANGAEDNNDFAFIDGNGNIIINGSGMVQIIDMLGRVLVTRDANNLIGTQGLVGGVYVLRLINGDHVKTQKIVVR